MKATFEITPELAAALKELRASQGVSASAAVRLALTAYLREKGIELPDGKTKGKKTKR